MLLINTEKGSPATTSPSPAWLAELERAERKQGVRIWKHFTQEDSQPRKDSDAQNSLYR